MKKVFAKVFQFKSS